MDERVDNLGSDREWIKNEPRGPANRLRVGSAAEDTPAKDDGCQDRDPRAWAPGMVPPSPSAPQPCERDGMVVRPFFALLSPRVVFNGG